MKRGARKPGMSRRTFLKAGAAAAASTLFFPGIVRADWKNIAKVILVRFGGGVRYRETFGDPLLTNLPKIRELMRQGTLYARVYNDGDTTHQGATLQLLTGRRFDASRATRSNPKDPTLFEHYRKEMGRKAGPTHVGAVLHTTVDFQYNYSADPSFGFDFRGTQFQPRLITYHHLNKVIAQEQDPNNDIVRRARGLQEQIWVNEDFEHIEDAARPEPRMDETESKFVNALFARERVPRLKTGDELVLFFAQAMMDDSEFKPPFLMVNFAGPDIAHQGSYTAYQEKIRHIDTLVDQLWTGIRRNREYANRTLLIVTPDCGRSLSGAGRGGFVDHVANDEGVRHVWALFLGPGIPTKVFLRPYAQIDIAKTIGEILHVPTPGMEGILMEETR